MYFKHTNSLIESIVNGQIDLEATIRRTLLLLSCQINCNNNIVYFSLSVRQIT